VAEGSARRPGASKIIDAADTKLEPLAPATTRFSPPCRADATTPTTSG